MEQQCFMKKNCKYHLLKIGFLYAALSLLFAIWEVYYILTGGTRVVSMLIPFMGLLLCMGLGIIFMMKDRQKSFVTNNDQVM